MLVRGMTSRLAGRRRSVQLSGLHDLFPTLNGLGLWGAFVYEAVQRDLNPPTL